jgi:hypothetical protein
MRLSLRFVAPSTIALFSTILMCGTATSQTNATAPLPSVTVEAPKQAARPKPVIQTETSRRTSSVRHTRSAAAVASGGRTSATAPNSILGRIAKLESVASNCNGGCESSMPHGKDPWVGCSESGGGQTDAPFSRTCRDSLTYKDYIDCVETKVFLGEYRNRAYWICSSLSAGNKFQVAEVKRSRHSH